MSKLILDSFANQAQWAVDNPHALSVRAKKVQRFPTAIRIDLNLEGIYYVITKLMKKQYAGGRPAVLKHLAMLTKAGTLTRIETTQETTWMMHVDVSEKQGEVV